MSNAIIKLENIKKIFYSEEVETHALSDITLTINKGEYLSISGPSGCGKSSLLSLLGLLDTSTQGQYTLSNRDVSDISKRERARIRNQEIGFIFQSFNLISDLDVEENVELPLTYRPDLKKNQRKQMVKDALDKVDMAHRSKHFPSQLSGGQQQRVAVARAIAGNPSILLADEPTGNLDSKNASAVMMLLDKLHAEGATICMVTHDPRSALRAGRNIDVLDGRIVADKKTIKMSSASELKI
ncbi:ABC transporter ATP-binding protein [Paremcibacter congregatus]|uniref:ABC transporter ATP-binding protein n=1 Tax=Paremcibacter congregatus TaxID=2043170 RepID=A0A2G4YNL2_9PROT|nr:ABC transporter ATP-binding protein [Paremcibacter congregatus]PHZ83883.1 ABC transporter ATP-binding protein [Paremcibacter congregatus]QDE27587.1 ABC transporter ATP-binding protein [Paremcibacter congregatus]